MISNTRKYCSMTFVECSHLRISCTYSKSRTTFYCITNSTRGKYAPQVLRISFHFNSQFGFHLQIHPQQYKNSALQERVSQCAFIALCTNIMPTVQCCLAQINTEFHLNYHPYGPYLRRKNNSFILMEVFTTNKKSSKEPFICKIV